VEPLVIVHEAIFNDDIKSDASDYHAAAEEVIAFSFCFLWFKSVFIFCAFYMKKPKINCL